jgi:thiol-disulfide isomerase/thioredoxin
VTQGAVRALAAILLLAGGCLLAGCTPGKPMATAAPPASGAPCLTTASDLASGAVSPSAGPAPGGGLGAMPGLSLPCFNGGAPATLASLGRPAVVNLWASWCAPCQAEMPEIQRYATGAAGRVAVIGVDTGDSRTGGASVLADRGITYPTLYDQRQQLLHAIGRNTLPATLFVDARGTIRYVVNGGPPLTAQAITGLVKQHLGIS